MIEPNIRELIDSTEFVDTHEHLVEEKARLGEARDDLCPCTDWSYLFWGYAASDLMTAGMSGEDHDRFLGPGADIHEKWSLFEPYWKRIRHTGYGRAALYSIRELYGEDDLTRDNYERVNEKFVDRICKGYYYEVLQEVSGVRSCQVNALGEPVFRETEYPDLLMQDISIMQMSTPPSVPALEAQSGKRARELGEWYDIIDWYFETFAARAVAVKSQAAYQRQLNYEDISFHDAAPLFRSHASGERLPWGDMKALQDHLFRYCIQKATENELPVKLHTGYYAGIGHMPLDRVGRNPGEMCRLASDFPDTTFVVMHIGYPYQEEMIALAKHYPNVVVDMCWAWIINPAASIRFAKDFLMAVPFSKLLTFGGDYLAVEQVVGHAKVARLGLAQALSELVSDGWLSVDDALALVPPLMHGNAEEIFHLQRLGARV